MTEQDLINSLEFKIIKKTLKLEYPWIKDIIPDGDPDMYKFTIYINVIFDPFELKNIVPYKVFRCQSSKFDLLKHGIIIETKILLFIMQLS